MGILRFVELSFLICILLPQYLLAAKSKQSSKSTKSKSSSSSNPTDGVNRVDLITSKMAVTSTMHLSDKNFSKFIVDRPRLYHAVIMFTATDPQYQCSVCVSTLDTFQSAANNYRNQFDFNTSLPEQRLAFFVVEVAQARQTFSDMKFETVPRMYVIPPRQVDSPKLKMAEFEVDTRVIADGVQNMLDEIKRLSGVQVQITMDSKPILFGLGVFAALVALLVSAASSDVGAAVFWYQNKYIWMLVGLVCFSVGVSGSIFCVIRGAPNFSYSRDGLEIFAGQGREQYFIEGLIVALWTVGCGLAGALLHYSPRLPFPPLRHAAVLLSMTVFIVLSLQIWGAYVDKTRWYSLRETLPGEVWGYLTSSVKKNSWLPKRLMRLSEYVLYDYKNWEGFQKKAKLLVLDYVERTFNTWKEKNIH